MEKLEHPLLIVDLVNRLAAIIAAALGIAVENPAEIVPDYLVMCGVVVLVIFAIGLFLRARLSVENPGKAQIVIEDLIGYVMGMLKEDVGPKGPRYIGLIATIGLFIWIGNLMGTVPGLIPATMNI